MLKNLFNYLHQTKVFTKLQSSNLCALQLFLIIDEFNSPSNYDPTKYTSNVFLDICKASTCKSVMKV